MLLREDLLEYILISIFRWRKKWNKILCRVKTKSFRKK